MSSLQEKTFLRLIKFSYDLSLKVTRTFTKTNILHNYNNSLAKFLESYKHELYHLWNNTTRCCACPTNPLLKQNRELSKEQFIKLYDIKGNTSPGHFKKGTGKSVIQHCLCGVTCIPSCSLNDLDIILIHTIIRNCVKLSQDDDTWLHTIREIRNKLAHTIGISFDQGRLEKWWTKLEGSVLGLAGKVPPLNCYAEAIEGQIKLLEIADLDRNALKEFISQIAEENTKVIFVLPCFVLTWNIGEKYRSGWEVVGCTETDSSQRPIISFIKILSKQEEFVEDVKQKMEEIKEEIIHHVERNRDTFLIDIKNLMFEAKTQELQQEVLSDDSTSQMQDADTCYVEWRLKNPGHWQVKDMKEKLHHFKSLFQGCFKLEFVYVGSLVIETSVNRQVITDMDLLIPAVRSFLETMVDVCKIDTETTAIVHINLSVIKQLHEDKSDILHRSPEVEFFQTEEGEIENICLGGAVEQTNTTEKWSASDNTFPPTKSEDRGLRIVSCDLCKEDKEVSSISWCPECNVTLCVDCVYKHKAGHRTFDVDLKLDLQFIKSQEYCPEHVQQKVEYFCPVHDFICCEICLDNKHKSCNEAISLDVACKNANKSTLLEELGMEMNNINKSVECLEEEINTNVSDINTESQHIESKIAQVKAKAIHQINESEKVLLLELQDETREIITEQREAKEKCRNISEKIITISNVRKFIKEHGTEKLIFVLANRLKQTVDEIDDTVATILSSKRSAKLSFDEQQNVTYPIPLLGKINKSEQPSQVKHTPVKQKYAQCIVPRANKPLTYFKLTFSFRTSDSVCITGMIVTEDNKLLLCNFNNNEVMVYNDNGHCVTTITMKHIPHDIALIPGGDQYVVTLPIIRSIQCINSKDLTPGGCRQLPSSNFTSGIAADKKYIYVGEYDRIFVLNYDGSVVREIIMEVNCNIYYLAVNDNGIYASGKDTYLYCIDHNNKIRQSEVIGTGRIRKIIIDRERYLYVAEGGSGKVHRLDRDLKETMTIGDDSVKDIRSICFNTNCTKLFVASEDGKNIAVFSCS